MEVLAKFDVIGTPKPQGSKVAFNAKHGGRAMTKESGGAGFAQWRNAVAEAAKRHREESSLSEPLDGPMKLLADFRFAMPSSRPAADRKRGWMHKTSAPDTSKLIRLIEDSMQAAGLIRDDARFAEVHATKVEHLDSWEGVTITIMRLEHS